MSSVQPQPHLNQNQHQTQVDFQKVDGLTKQLEPAFQTLRFLGRCPLSFSQSQKDMQVLQEARKFTRTRMVFINYDFKFCSRSFIISGLPALLTILLMLIGLFQSSAFGFQAFPSGKFWPDYSGQEPTDTEEYPTAVLIILSSFEVIFSLEVIIEYFIVWWTTPRLVKWLNNWNTLEMELRSLNLKSRGKNDLVTSASATSARGENFLGIHKFRNWGILYVLIPTGVFGTIIFKNGLQTGYPLATLLVIFYSFSSTLLNLIEDYKIVLMFKCMEVFLRQVKTIVKNCQEVFRSGEISDFTSNPDFNICKSMSMPGAIRVQEIRQWHKILVGIRKQIHLAGNYMGVHQLLSIATLIYFASSAIFVTAVLISGSNYGHGREHNNQILLVIVFSILSWVRLLFKIRSASRITEQEIRIAGLLKDIELCEEDKGTRAELKELYTMLTTRPAEISLSGYISLNTPLVLVVFSQILTQFIVFAQFSSGLSL